MVDPETVRRRLREIDRRVGLLAVLRASGQETFVGDLALQAQAERHLQLAIQAVIDTALHLVAEDSAQTPETYGAAMGLLAERGVVVAELAERMRLAIGLRNLLVHGYLEVDPARLWEHLDRLDDLRAFAAAVEDHLA